MITFCLLILLSPKAAAGNPRQLSSYAFVFQYQAAIEGRLGTRADARPRPDAMELIRTLRGDAVSRSTTAYGTANSYSWNSPSTFCNTATLREDLPNGLTACRRKQGEDEVWSRIGEPPMSLHPRYIPPHGETFVVIAAI